MCASRFLGTLAPEKLGGLNVSGGAVLFVGSRCTERHELGNYAVLQTASCFRSLSTVWHRNKRGSCTLIWEKSSLVPRGSPMKTTGPASKRRHPWEGTRGKGALLSGGIWGRQHPGFPTGLSFETVKPYLRLVVGEKTCNDF